MSLRQWMSNADSAATRTQSDATRTVRMSESQGTDDGLIDLTDEQPPQPPPATHTSHSGGSNSMHTNETAAAMTPKQRKQAQLAGQLPTATVSPSTAAEASPFNLWRKSAASPPQQHSTSTGGGGGSGGSANSAMPRAPSSSSALAMPRLQLSRIPHTPPTSTPAPAAVQAASHSAAASSASAAATAASPYAGVSVKSEQKPTKLADLLTGAAAAAATPPFTSPLSNPSSSPPLRTPLASSVRQAVAAAAAASTPPSPIRSQQSVAAAAAAPAIVATPAAAAASVAPLAPFALRNANGDVLEEGPEEKLVRRRREIDVALAELDDEMNQLHARARMLKAERRAVEEELNRPVQLPFMQPQANKPLAAGVPVGGASSLLAGSDFWRGTFPWDAAALEVLRNVFGLSGWRVSQREVINATMSRKDCFCIMPTGAGKSLLYQLPAVLNEGCTLVVSPLLSLMEDQLIHLRRCRIECAMLCGTTTKEETNAVHQSMLDKHSQLRLLFCTPEKIAKSKLFLSKLEKMHEMGKLVRIVIDEVHCCSSWGHDFRTDYAKLGMLKTQFPRVPILAVTATATERVVRDCQAILNIRGCQFFKTSFNRPNLHFSVHDKAGTALAVVQDMYNFIEKIGHLDSSGIVYCYSKKETVEVCSQLCALGIKADFYNSDVEPLQRQRVHHRWVSGHIKVVVATNAFGLGINKPDVRFVLHHTVPQGVESYYQEAGRCGRDGLKGYCALWYSPRDLARQSTRVWGKQDMTQHLYPLISYCHKVDQCRRVLMSRYFGEQLHASQCGLMCDVCELVSTSSAAGVVPFVDHDLSEAAVQLCQFVESNHGGKAAAASGKGKGKRKRATALTQKQLVDATRSKSSGFALPKSFSRDDCERLVIELMLQGVLREQFRNTAYSTNSYLECDPAVANMLRRGDMLIRLRGLDHKWMKKHAAGGAASAGGSGSGSKARRRSSQGSGGKGGKAAAAASAATSEESDSEPEEDEYDEEQYAVEMDDEQAAAAAAAAAGGHDDDDEEEAYQPVPLRAPSASSSGIGAATSSSDRKPRSTPSWTSGGGGAARVKSAPADDFDIDDDDGRSSEDMPLHAIKKVKREPSSARLQQQQPKSSKAQHARPLPPSVDSPPPRRYAASAAAKKLSKRSQDDMDDFLDDEGNGNEPTSGQPWHDDDDEAAFQEALRQSTVDF